MGVTVFIRWFSRHSGGKAYGHLHPGQHYRVERDFRDHDGRLHQRGQHWRYRTYKFLPYEDGVSLFFLTEGGDDLQIRLQGRIDAEAVIIPALSDILLECEPFHRSVFAGLLAIESEKLVAFDGVDRVVFGWHDVTKVTAFYGQQHYDETRCLTISHRRGTAIFLAETHSVWHPFLDGLETRLERVVPRQRWLKTLDEDRSRSIPVFKRSRL